MEIKSYWAFSIFLLVFVVLVSIAEHFGSYIPYYSNISGYLYLIPLLGALVYVGFLLKWLFQDFGKRFRVRDD